MGVPSFFRWLSRKYPKIISPVIEEEPQVVDGVVLPLDYSGPNPNGELDNLYLDMNGIVHPCSHPEGRPAPDTEDEMLLAVFEYTNRVLNMARPRKILVMAIDGVAPRAKMNQQRARRFRSVRDAAEASERRERELAQREQYGEIIDEAILKKKPWDSNAITPGTPFMDKLATALRYWTAFKLATDPGWRNLQVIISDASVPGEGEHKIMNFIRSQRADPQYDPNTTHCIYGLDADLIFLGLATHEPHFKILREDVFYQSANRTQYNRSVTPASESNTGGSGPLSKETVQKKPFLWLHVSVLREYLAAELYVPNLPFPFDLERAIDDWVFMCFFCGNDFLPHLPSLDVRENSIDILLQIWKIVLPGLKTYMTCDGNLNLASVEKLLEQLGYREPDIFKSRYTQLMRRNEMEERRQNLKNSELSQGQDRHPIRTNEQLQLYDTSGQLFEGSWNLTTHDMVRLKKEIMLANEGDEKALEIVRAESQKNNELVKSITKEEMAKIVEQANKSNFTTAELIKKKLAMKKRKLEMEEQASAQKDSLDTNEEHPTKKLKTENGDTHLGRDEKEIAESNTGRETKEEQDKLLEDDGPEIKFKAAALVSHAGVKNEIIDTDTSVRLYEPGYETRYYVEKFQISAADIPLVRRGLVRAYIEGVSWVLRYYYQGCASWTWYYPFHYAPFASDFVNIAALDIKFELGEPFLPFEQLMSVLPAASGHVLPPIFRPLMSSPDSPIIDFYPTEFPIDMNGKKMSWQGIALLPFIDEKRLLKVVREQYPKLSESERERNKRKEDILLISNKHPNYDKLVKKLCKSPNDNTSETGETTQIVLKHFKHGLSGIVDKDQEGFALNEKLPCPIEVGVFPELSTNLFLKMLFRQNKLVVPNKSILLNGYIPPVQALDSRDLDSVLRKNDARYQKSQSAWAFSNIMRNNFVTVGPSGDTQYKPRAGGYKSFFHMSQMSTGGPEGGNYQRFQNGSHYRQQYTSNAYYRRGEQVNQGRYGNYRRDQHYGQGSVGQYGGRYPNSRYNNDGNYGSRRIPAQNRYNDDSRHRRF